MNFNLGLEMKGVYIELFKKKKQLIRHNSNKITTLKNLC